MTGGWKPQLGVLRGHRRGLIDGYPETIDVRLYLFFQLTTVA